MMTLILFFLDGFFCCFFARALFFTTFTFFFTVSLSAFLSLSRMHMSHGVSSPSSLNRPLIYGGLDLSVSRTKSSAHYGWVNRTYHCHRSFFTSVQICVHNDLPLYWSDLELNRRNCSAPFISALGVCRCLDRAVLCTPTEYGRRT